jgi:SAM-dependent methyltransferase
LFAAKEKGEVERTMLCPDAALSEDRYTFVRQYLARTPAPATGGVVFDVGAGEAEMKSHAEAAGYKWFGFDLHPMLPSIAQWDMNLPFVDDRRADIVLLMDVIEHTFNPGFAMQNVANLLKSDGRLVITMPNPRWSRARTLNLVSGFSACFTPHDLDVNHHVFATWPHIVLRLISDCGLELERYVTLDRHEIGAKPIGLMSLVRAVEWLVRWGIELHDPSARGMSYALVVRHRTTGTEREASLSPSTG